MGENIDERLGQLVAVKRTFEAADRNSSPKIQRVPAILRQNPEFARYCSPKMISFGPIHHRSENENLKMGQHYKSLWASRYIEEYARETNKSSANEASRFLHDVIQDNIGELKKLFSDDVLEGYDDKELTWMLFVDGCSLLYYMDKVDREHPGALELKVDQLMYAWRDILLLENQFPMRVLELLSKRKGADLEFLVTNFKRMGIAKPAEDRETTITMIKLDDDNNMPKPPTHILDAYRSNHVDQKHGAYVGNKEDGHHQMNPQPVQDVFKFWQRYKNVRDLRTAGIRLKASKMGIGERHDVSFSSGWFGGELRLPLLAFGDSSPYVIRNLIAYEMCPDFPNNFDCCSYFSFMDSLIDDAEDVKEIGQK